MRLIKWVSLGVGALVALVVLGVLVIVWLVDPNSFKSNIESAVRDATGREFKLVGDIELGFFPWLALRSGEGQFGNAEGFGPGPMVSWKSAQVGAKLFPLLSGTLVADRVILKGADVRLVRHADGSANWQGMGGQKPVDPNAKPMSIHIDGIEIEDSRVLFVDEGVPRRVEVTALNLTTGEIAPGKPFTKTVIAGVLHLDGFVAAGMPFRIAAPKVVLPQDFSALDAKEFEVAFGVVEVSGNVGGTLGKTPRISGSVESNSFDPRALLTAVGIAPPKTTDANALSKVRVSGNWAFDAGAVRVQPFALDLDDTHFGGSFARPAGEGAVGEFVLSGTSIDLGRYLPPSDPASPPFVFPQETLKALRFRGDLNLVHATLDDIDMKEVRLHLLLDEKGLRNESAPATAKP